MLRFNQAKYNKQMIPKKFQYILCCGSTNTKLNLIFSRKPFQYILCCGSTPTIKLPKIKKNNFNTSYVAVQLLPDNFFDMIIIEFQYILCCGSTLKGNKEIDIVYVFQYILCCGSTVPYPGKVTTHLKFQYILCCGSTIFDDLYVWVRNNFNTSYVAVQQNRIIVYKLHQYNFNTSYVAVQLIFSNLIA